MKEFNGTFSLEETESIGKEFLAKCLSTRGYEHCLTKEKEYVIKIILRILPMSPLCSFIGDNGKTGQCHLERFIKLREINPSNKKGENNDIT